MASKVLYGPYVGKTKSELLVLLTAAQQAFASGDSKITGGSVGGQSFGRAPGMSAAERIRQIQYALSQVDPDYVSPGQAVYGRFTSPGDCAPIP